VTLVDHEKTQPSDWGKLWKHGELVHYGTGSIYPFLGPVHLRALETHADKRNAGKYILARATPLDARPSRSLFILAVPKPKHVDSFVEASKGLLGGTPGKRLLGSIGLLHAIRTTVGWRVDYVQSHYNNASDFPLKRSLATQYAGWANRAMETVAEHVVNDGVRLAFYTVTWAERERVIETTHDELEPTAAVKFNTGSTRNAKRVFVPQNALSLSHFRSAFRSRGYHVLHLSGSRHFGSRNRSVLLAFRL